MTLLRRGTRRTKMGAAAFGVLFLMLLMSSCSSSGGRAFTSSQLASKIISAPYGYQVDPTQGASGTISPALFAQFGGYGSAAKVGFVAGFKQNYVDYDTEEGIAVTVLEFHSTGAASAYLSVTAPQTLSFAAATHKPFGSIRGSVEADGTKPNGGVYSHAVVMVNRKFYIQLVYFTAQPSPAPIEFTGWANAQYHMLQQ